MFDAILEIAKNYLPQGSIVGAMAAGFVIVGKARDRSSDIAQDLMDKMQAQHAADREVWLAWRRQNTEERNNLIDQVTELSQLLYGQNTKNPNKKEDNK